MPFCSQLGVAESVVIRVPQDFPTIKQAVDAAHAGDTIIVSEGVYAEGQVNIAKSNLSLKADGAVVVDGLHQEWVFYVTADNVTIQGFTAIHSGHWWLRAGICLDHAHDCVIKNNTLEHNLFGILVFASTNNIVLGNTACLNDVDGIALDYSSNNMIINNTATRNSGDGIYVPCDNNTLIGNTAANNEQNGIVIIGSNNTLVGNMATNNKWNGISVSSVSCGNVLRNNNMTNNRYNFALLSLSPDSLNDIDTSNLVNGKRIYYLVNQHDTVVDPSTFPNLGYLAIVNSTRITVRNITVTNNRHGVVFSYVTDSTIENVNATSNGYGIQLSLSTNNTITGNTATANRESGINLEGSHHNTLVGNTVAHSIGKVIGSFTLFSSHHNTVAGNTVTNNSQGVHLQHSHDNIIIGNTLTYNRWEEIVGGGIFLSAGPNYNNVFVGNTLMNNELGVGILSSNGDTFYHNNFINNTIQTLISSSAQTTWDDDYPNGGNYWSDYNGTDSDSGLHQNVTGCDGIGDTPFIIGVDIQDCYPLMAPWRPLVGDVNGDGTINIQDIVQAAIAYGSTQSDPNWNPFADLAPPWRIINILDLVTATANYGKET